MLKKLRTRFICITMSFATVMLCMLLGMVIHFTRSAMEAESLRLLQSAAMAPERPGKHRNDLHMPLFVVQVDREGSFAQIEGELEMVPDAGTLEQITRQALEAKKQSGILQAYSLRFYKAFSPGGHRIVFSDISTEQAILSNLTKICALIWNVGFAAFLCITILLTKWAIRPVAEAWNQQKQFVADASHELKTPLTVIMTNAEMLQGDLHTIEDKQRLSEGILTTSRQMRTLVEGMLELARADNGSVKTCFAPVEFSGLIARECLPFETLYFENGRTLISEIEEGITLQGSASHLGQVLSILLDNAAKYSAPGATVRLSLKRQGNRCLLRVDSPGEAISREDLKNIFKRFYRVDKARSRDGSYGLGLSIAQRIVEEHGGRIWAEGADGINAFFVSLPVSS